MSQGRYYKADIVST